MNTPDQSSCGCTTSRPAVTGIRISELKAALAAAPALPLTVVWTDGEPIEPHFHVTEVGRVQKDFVDCGGTVRRLVTCLLQTWVGEDLDHRITAGKLLKAFEHAAHYDLDNLTAVLDVNRLGQRGETMIGWNTDVYVKRAEAFGWHAIEIDGHDVEAIDRAYAEAVATTGKPPPHECPVTRTESAPVGLMAMPYP